MAGKVTKTALERFMAKIMPVTESGCWLWMNAVSDSGYGIFNEHGKNIMAHRWSYGYFVGPIPAGYEADHLCRVPCCVNPGHLEAVTPRVNCLRGSSSPALNARKTHCKRGHPFDDANTRIVRATGHRKCRQCTQDIWRRHYQKNRNRYLTFWKEYYEKRKARHGRHWPKSEQKA